MDTIAKRLKWARERHGAYKSPTEAARAFNWPPSTMMGYENEDRIPGRERAKELARKYRVRFEWLVFGEGLPNPKIGDNSAIIEGYVGAGAEFIPFTDADPGLGDAPLAVEANSAAVLIRGDSMYPRYFDGELIYYIKELYDPAGLIGRECVVKLRDGRMYVKILRRGSKRRLFNLESWNHPTIEDQQVEWASPVTWRHK